MGWRHVGNLIHKVTDAGPLCGMPTEPVEVPVSVCPVCLYLTETAGVS